MLGLVLGGGAAKGYAHIGAIKVLDEEGIKPDIIVGASMGALIGGLYAAGYSGLEQEEIATEVDRRKKRWLFRLHLSKKGFVDGRNIVKYLSPHIRDKKIEELPVKFAVVATDIEDHSEIIIDKGELIQAIRAAISIPVVFMPHTYAGRVLIDGGFVNPLPINVAQRLGAQKVIAVNVLRTVEYPEKEISSVHPTGKTYNIKKVFFETFDYITSRLIDYQMQNLEDGLLININTEGIGMSQFEKARRAIDRGYKETTKYRKKLHQFK
jgi:NTE family protein